MQTLPHVMVMARVPIAGRGKTRLARHIGTVAAVRFTRITTSAVLSRLDQPARWRLHLAVTPASGRRARAWPPHIDRLPQRPGDLGQRMQAILAHTAPGPVLIIGTDIPGITAPHIADAIRLLRRHDAVLGPSGDGGFWLIGLKRTPRLERPFSGVRWSTQHALADTLANLRHCTVALAATLPDVDDATTLAAQAHLIGRRIVPRLVARRD